MAVRRTSRRHHRGRGSNIVLLVFMVLVAFTLVRAALSRSSEDSDLKVVRVRTGSGFRLQPVLAEGQSFESFSRIVERTKPYAAINGTFYDAAMRPLGDILIDGKLVNRGHYRNAIAVTRRGVLRILRRRARQFDWNGCTSGISSGPLLASHGKVCVDPVAEGFSRRSVTLKATRSGVGITRDGDLLMVVSTKPLTFHQFASKMIEQGAIEAVNLDGGGACGLYHRGRMIARPTLPMTNVFAVLSPGSGRD